MTSFCDSRAMASTEMMGIMYSLLRRLMLTRKELDVSCRRFIMSRQLGKNFFVFAVVLVNGKVFTSRI